MKSIELLKDLGLLDRHGGATDLSRFSNDDLRQLVTYYARKRRELADAEINEAEFAAPSAEMPCLISSMQQHEGDPSVLGSTLFYDIVYVQDAFFEAADMGPEDALDRPNLTEALRRVSSFVPLIQQHAVVTLPVSYLVGFRARNAPPEPDWTVEDAAKAIKQCLKRPPVVTYQQDLELEFSFGELRSDNKVEVVMNFRGDHVKGRWLLDAEVASAYKDKPYTRQLLPFPNNLPHQVFGDWRLQMFGGHLSLANQLHAVYLTESELEARACGYARADRTPQTPIRFLLANLPYLRLDSGEVVARIRMKHHEALSSLRRSILDMCADLEGSGADFDTQAQKLYREKIEPQVVEVGTRLQKIVYATTGGAIMAASAVGMASLADKPISASVATAFIGIGAFAGALQHIPEYLSRRRGPVLIWLQLAKPPR